MNLFPLSTRHSPLATQSGFTLIESIVAVLVFSIVSSVAAGLFARAVNVERRATAAQKIQENALFAIESISRDVRVSQICPSGSGCSTNYLELEHPIKGTSAYWLDTTRGVIVKEDDGVQVDVTSPEINVTRFDFVTIGSGIGDDAQPKIVIIATFESRIGQVFSVNFQTTITSRDVRDEFFN